MFEIVATARALGYPVRETLPDLQIERTRTMGAYKASTLIDFERGQPLELESLFLEPLRQARKAKTSAPRLAALCAVLEQLDPARAQFPNSKPETREKPRARVPDKG
jgi:2-dehydropantoate 2-reductase